MVASVVSSLTLSQAEIITAAALAEAQRAGFLPLAVAVLDSGGHLIMAKREDGSGLLRLDIAVAKAWGALGLGLDARTIGERLGRNPPFLNALSATSGGRLAPNAGGLLILDTQGRAIGAVGISGDTGDNDEVCAAASIRAAGFETTSDRKAS